MSNLLSHRKQYSSNSDAMPSLGFSSLRVRMASAYMWTNVLFVTVLISFGVVAANWLTVWGPYPSTRDTIWTWWFSSAFVPASAITLGISLLIYALLGGLFGLLTSSKLVQRLRDLGQATIIVANGDYGMRIPVRRKDEVGILEAQFNEMASHLEESRKREQDLLAQNVRLQERTRLARELHDTISQQLFSLRLLAEGMQNTLPETSELREKLALFGRTADVM
uniref:HAMP domain-containing protein n=1 Tax=Thermosporothrix sp. COM3 TaxID=2490863 RepID=A0A455SK15_9CHLR|nr:hypothetical protein KTC_27110 [Thermosporothrix sp. COM3]